MKDCPVCHAKAFDDAKMCYGCLHRFDEGPTCDEASANHEPRGDMPPAFAIRFTPEERKAGDIVWSCAVEVA